MYYYSSIQHTSQPAREFHDKIPPFKFDTARIVKLLMTSHFSRIPALIAFNETKQSVTLCNYELFFSFSSVKCALVMAAATSQSQFSLWFIFPVKDYVLHNGK